MRFLFKLSEIGLFLCLVSAAAIAQNNGSRQVNSLPVSGVAAVVNGEMLSLQDLHRQSAPEISRAKLNRNDPQANAKIMAIQRKVLESMIVDKLIS